MSARIGVVRSRVSREVVRLPGAELCKWTGAVAMLVEHVCTHALGMWSAVWPQVFGAFAFPLFVAGFAGLAGARADGWERTAVRLGWFAMLAQGAGYLVGREGQLNVLATFALGAWIASAVATRRWWIVPAGVALGGFVEFNVAGVGAVAASLLVVNDPRGGYGRWPALVVCAAAMPTWNPYAPPVIVWFSCVAAGVVAMLPISVPQQRGAFAIGYVAQWPALRALRELRDWWN